MSILASAAALVMLTGDAGQTAPRSQTPPPATAPAAPASDLTSSLNSGPPRPADYLAPAPRPEADEEAPPPRPAARPSAPAAAPPRAAPATPTNPPRSTSAPAASGASAPTRSTTAPPASTTRPPASGAPATTRPSTPASTPAPTAPTAPAATTRPPAAAPATTPPRAAPPTSGPAAAPAAPGVTVLDAVAIDGLPFTVDLPEGFEIVTGRPGSDFRIYTIRRGGRSFVMVYTGPASQFPIYSGDVVEAGGRASVIAAEGGQRRAMEHLFQRTTAPREVHIWTMSLEGADRALAERIAQSVDVK